MAHWQTIVFLNDLIVSRHHSTDENVETVSTGVSRSECWWGPVELQCCILSSRDSAAGSALALIDIMDFLNLYFST